MSAACCAGLTPDRVDELAVIGGSHDPLNEPGGELRACRTCGQRFLYTYDHDNSIGYEASPKTLDAMTPAQVRDYLPRAIAVAERQLAYFAAQPGSTNAMIAGEYREELSRLISAA